jgi:hypothetical protein
MSIPHTESNLSPTWSPFRGRIHHRPDAVAYTYTEADYDDPEMMASRTAATLALTGDPEGEIDDRQYFRLFQPNNDNAAPDTAAQGPNDGTEDDTEEQEYNNSQDFHGHHQEGPTGSDDEDHFHEAMSESSDTKRAKSPPKKRKVDDEPAEESEFYIQIVCAAPPSATKFDMLAFLAKFRPNFGRQFRTQVQMCTYSKYRHEGPSFLIGCPSNDVSAFKQFLSSHLLFNKFNCAHENITSVEDVNIIPTNAHDEKLAEDPLAQYLKIALHPSLQVELQNAIRARNTGSELMRDFTAELSNSGNYHDTKPPPNKFINVPDNNLIDGHFTWSGYYKMWYNGKYKSF